MRYCHECGKESQGSRCPEHAEKHRQRNKKSWSKNKEAAIKRTNAYQKNLRETDPEKIRRYRLKYLYGITPETYDQLLQDQGGVCYICREVESPLVIDHNHETGEVRGLLCKHCNSGLGFFRDTPAFLARAIEYLER